MDVLRKVASGVTSFFSYVRTYVGLFGIFLSIVLHELFHIIVHWGDIQSIRIFPHPTAIVEIIVSTPENYDVNYEEFIVYSITIIVLLFTACLITALSDKRNTKTLSEVLLPQWSELHTISQAEFLEIAHKTLR
jgi:hypothetical protein